MCPQTKAIMNNISKTMRIINSENNAGTWPPVHVSLGKNEILSFNPIPMIHFKELTEDVLFN